jgi:molybdate-binding protein
MPYREVWYPKKKKREDAQIGGTSVWPVVERAKEAGVSAVKRWRRNKTIRSAAQELRCFDGVNAIKDALQELVRQKKSSR